MSPTSARTAARMDVTLKAIVGAGVGVVLAAALLAIGALEADDAPSAGLIVVAAALLGCAFATRREIRTWLQRSPRTMTGIRLVTFTGV